MKCPTSHAKRKLASGSGAEGAAKAGASEIRRTLTSQVDGLGTTAQITHSRSLQAFYGSLFDIAQLMWEHNPVRQPVLCLTDCPL
ncbi:hypothetical protein CA13_28980 [Planctomycetes bacterium CA13]|uniref:Uncharacterized protein n=1 Tax=Novipirellula herctigrandis TaxID=2527986 RepID=A0A5C5Z2M7_9BACT|nr:hypothetical protein CA13_28980 [Planctomycetes bacterium CA13]